MTTARIADDSADEEATCLVHVPRKHPKCRVNEEINGEKV
jgi:hypothetical protein